MTLSICPTEEASWDVIWKWAWFARGRAEPAYWRDEQAVMRPLLYLLSQWKMKTILDCSCGLGCKTILLAKRGYEVEGSDASAVAIRYAPMLARQYGLVIRFFRSRYQDLGKRSHRSFDGIYSDAFDWIRNRRALKTAARGIRSVLNPGGRFVFDGVMPEWTRSDLAKIIQAEWRRRKRFVVGPPVMKGRTRMTRVEVAEKTPEGIVENSIHLIEQRGRLRAEVAFQVNLVKWTWKDYEEALMDAGFSAVEWKKVGSRIFNIGVT